MFCFYITYYGYAKSKKWLLSARHLGSLIIIDIAKWFIFRLQKKSTCTIRSPANVCCVQFSPYSSHLLMFGSADHKIYGYDLRHMRIPWCTLAGHEKTVSYVKFMDSETIVSASTDNTLKLWDLNKTSLSGMSSDACHTTFSGHTNKKVSPISFSDHSSLIWSLFLFIYLFCHSSIL